MTKPVLCAVDVSHPQGEKVVIQRAAQLADLDGAQLDVVTVVPDFGTSLVGGFFKEGHMDAMKSEARSRLHDLVSEALGAERDAQVRHIVAIGNVYEEILKAASVDDASLIVIGAHKPDFKDYLLGPNAARVTRHAQTSVYIVRV